MVTCETKRFYQCQGMISKIKKVDESDEKEKDKNVSAGRKVRTSMKRARDMKQRLTGKKHCGPNVTIQIKSVLTYFTFNQKIKLKKKTELVRNMNIYYECDVIRPDEDIFSQLFEGTFLKLIFSTFVKLIKHRMKYR